MTIREIIKWRLYPGINLHARLRYRILPDFFESSQDDNVRTVVDAGCGNGMLSYKSYLKGNRVIGVSIKDKEIAGCRKLFHEYLGISKEKLSFQKHNLYQLDELCQDVDEIICSEVLEHIVDDKKICRIFWNILKPGGILHLCCPNSQHPDNRAKELDKHETGGHVRSGYSIEAYKALLEPIGFYIKLKVGIGGPIRQMFNKYIIKSEKKFGFPFAFFLFLVSLPFLIFDSAVSRVPYSLYIKAVKE